MKIKYESLSDDPLSYKMVLGNASVALGKAPGDDEHYDEWELIDASNGKRLEFVRAKKGSNEGYDLGGWMSFKAHTHLLRLYEETITQARLDKRWAEHIDSCQQLLESITHLVATHCDIRQCNAEDIMAMDRVRINLSMAYNVLDDLQDQQDVPDED